MAKDNDFLEQQRRAIERMNEMHLRQQIKTGGYPMPPAPSFVKVNNEAVKAQNSRADDIIPEKNDNTQSEKQANQGFIRTPKAPPQQGGFLGNFKLPFLSGGGLDRDISLLLGLILILANEKADRKLLLALLYILM